MTKCRWGIDVGRYEGNSYGYSLSNTRLMEAAEKRGMLNRRADIIVSLCHPEFFQRQPDKINVLFTMYESETLPPGMTIPMNRADAIIVPSQWCADVFRRYTQLPIYVVPLGVDTTEYIGVKRPRPYNKPFRWLWVGADNLRKGWVAVVETWRRYFLPRWDTELYLKTTITKEDIRSAILKEEPICAVGGQGVMRQMGPNITMDSRNISQLEMMKLYAAADGFLFPTMGEGFGLTLLEAMATALPCLAVLKSGVMEFASRSTCFGIRYDEVEMDVAWVAKPELSHKTIGYRADLHDMARQMDWMMKHHRKITETGMRAYRRAQGFTWDESARKLERVLETIAMDRPATAAEGKVNVC
jgi:glycosyltransferase involved in cell wall biosynthesis